MVQRQALPVIPAGRQKPKPWEVNNYIVASYHKAGVTLSEHLALKILNILGAPMEVLGHVEYPCYSLRKDGLSQVCYNLDAPFRLYTDSFNASLKSAEQRKSGNKKVLVAGLVRDPLEMVASAYCYHHYGQEFGNWIFPVQDIMQMGPEEGTEVTAKALLPLAEWMTSVFENPDNNTLRLEFDDLTKSSTGFDLGVQRSCWLHQHFLFFLVEAMGSHGDVGEDLGKWEKVKGFLGYQVQIALEEPKTKTDSASLHFLGLGPGASKMESYLFWYVIFLFFGCLIPSFSNVNPGLINHG